MTLTPSQRRLIRKIAYHDDDGSYTDGCETSDMRILADALIRTNTLVEAIASRLHCDCRRCEERRASRAGVTGASTGR